jgi:hypothetical protein
MNPNSVIRPWLLACGAQFGVRYAFDYRWPDWDTVQEEPFFTYRLQSSDPDQTGFLIQADEKSGNNHVRTACKQHITSVDIRLYNAEDGLYILGACGLGAEMSQTLRDLFGSKGVQFYEIDNLQTNSQEADDEIFYVHSMQARFYERVELSLTATNGAVDEIKINLESGGKVWTIDDNGYS